MLEWIKVNIEDSSIAKNESTEEAQYGPEWRLKVGTSAKLWKRKELLTMI